MNESTLTRIEGLLNEALDLLREQRRPVTVLLIACGLCNERYERTPTRPGEFIYLRCPKCGNETHQHVVST